MLKILSVIFFIISLTALMRRKGILDGVVLKRIKEKIKKAEKSDLKLTESNDNEWSISISILYKLEIIFYISYFVYLCFTIQYDPNTIPTLITIGVIFLTISVKSAKKEKVFGYSEKTERKKEFWETWKKKIIGTKLLFIIRNLIMAIHTCTFLVFYNIS